MACRTNLYIENPLAAERGYRLRQLIKTLP